MYSSGSLRNDELCASNACANCVGHGCLYMQRSRDCAAMSDDTIKLLQRSISLQRFSTMTGSSEFADIRGYYHAIHYVSCPSCGLSRLLETRWFFAHHSSKRCVPQMLVHKPVLANSSYTQEQPAQCCCAWTTALTLIEQMPLGIGYGFANVLANVRGCVAMYDTRLKAPKRSCWGNASLFLIELRVELCDPLLHLLRLLIGA